jgi:hypothetical protein
MEKVLNVSAKSVNLHDLEFGKGFLDMTPPKINCIL